MGAGNPIALGGPINTNGGISSAVGTTSTAGATPDQSYGHYVTQTGPNGQPYQAWQATDASGNNLNPVAMPMQGAPNAQTLAQQTPTTYNAGSSFAQGVNSNFVNPYAGTTSPYFQAAQAQSLGNLAGAQQATAANRVNQVTPYGNLNYTQSVDQNGNPTWTATQSINPQLQGLANQSLSNLTSAQQNPLTGINPGETYSDAIMRRLQPQMAQQAEGVKSDLANQGIVPGTQAYDNAMRTFNQQQNDLLTSAQIQGMNTGLQAQQLLGNQAAQIKNLITPNYVNVPLQSVAAGPDYMGALQTQTNANIAAQNAALGQATANTAGLYGLGSAGILGLAANPGLVSSGINGLSNLFSSGGYNTATNNYFTDPTTAGSFAGSAFAL
jgi:hypothetical protein